MVHLRPDRHDATNAKANPMTLNCFSPLVRSTRPTGILAQNIFHKFDEQNKKSS